MTRLVALVAVLAALGAAPAAHAAAGLEVAVGDQTVTLDAADLQAGADVAGVTYVVDGAPQVVTGMSLRAALTAAGVDPDTPSAVTVRGAGGARLQITEPQLDTPPPFPEGPVVAWVGDDGVTRLLRPATPTAPARVLASAPDAPLALEPVDATVVVLGIFSPADGETREVGERIAFAAAANGTGAASMSYSWDFGDGTTASGADPRHVYRRPGRYRVTVVASDGGRVGGTKSILLTIEAAEPEAQPERDPEPEAEGTGAATGTPSGGSGTGTGTGTGPSGGYVAPAPAPSSSPAPSSTPAPDPQPEKRPKRKPDDEPPPPDAPAPELEPVEGIVLGATAAPPEPAPAAPASAGLTPTATAASDGDDLGVPWVALAIVLAFFSGLTAARVQRRRWAPRARR